MTFPQSRPRRMRRTAALRGLVGPEGFHRAFVTYGRRWVGGHPQPYDFFNAMSAAAGGQDLSWFWTTWFYEGWPLHQVLDSVTTTGDSVTISIGDEGLAPMPVRLAVTRADGSVQRLEVPVDVWLRGARRTAVRVAREPRIVRITIDPAALFPDVDRTKQTWAPEGMR